MSDVNNVRVFHTHPSCEHASKGPTEDYHRAICAVSLLEKKDELYEIHESFFSRQVNKIFLCSGGIFVSEGPTLSKVPMLRVHKQTFQVFCYVVVIPSCISVEHLDGSFVATVHQDGSLLSLGPMCNVYQVFLLESLASEFEVVMRNFLVVVEDLVGQGVSLRRSWSPWETQVRAFGSNKSYQQKEQANCFAHLVTYDLSTLHLSHKPCLRHHIRQIIKCPVSRIHPGTRSTYLRLPNSPAKYACETNWELLLDPLVLSLLPMQNQDQPLPSGKDCNLE